MAETVYIVTDIETDGPDPGRNSMLSLASVAVSSCGKILGSFERCIAPLVGSAPDQITLAWFQAHPEAWLAATNNPEPPEKAMQDFVTWVRELDAIAVFTAHPLTFEGLWVDWYLRRFLELRLAWGFGPGDPPFAGYGLDLGSLVMGTMGWDYSRCRRQEYPGEWFGGIEHTHRALDDALGYANVLVEMLRRAREH